MTVAARRETTVAKNVVTIALLLLFVLSLAYANGANDVSKGVATLVGGGVTTYRRGLAWGTLWTVAGALLALVVSVGSRLPGSLPLARGGS